MSNPTGFLQHSREEAKYRPTQERLADWRELYLADQPPKLKTQASRCMDCGVPFCQSNSGCPVDNLIPEWNSYVSEGRWREALDRLHLTNNFPEFTGRLCPAPCESACVLGINSDPVTIKNVEWAIVDKGFKEGWIQPQPASFRTGRRVAIVGSGPAGLAAAQQLARKGHAVTVFEKNEKVGGLLRFGIPEFKLEKWRIDRRIQQLEAEGVEFKTSAPVTSLEDLRESYDAIGLAIGAERAFDLDIPGRDLSGVVLAMDYLGAQNREKVGELTAFEKNVIIIGGGDTGSDCLGTALRQGAKSVMQFELLPEPPRDRAPSTPWPLWPMKLRTSHAHLEGGSREWSISTKRFEGSDARVTGLVAETVDRIDGQFVAREGSERHFDAELVILAIGFKGVNVFDGLEKTPRGAIRVNGKSETSTPSIFAAGDATRGASLIVWAIAEGRKMAAAIDQSFSR